MNVRFRILSAAYTAGKIKYTEIEIASNSDVLNFSKFISPAFTVVSFCTVLHIDSEVVLQA
jgi:hypothetical protein